MHLLISSFFLFVINAVNIFEAPKWKKIACDINTYPADQDFSSDGDLLNCYAQWHTAFLDSVSPNSCQTNLVYVVETDRGLGDTLGTLTVCLAEALRMRLPFFVKMGSDWSVAVKLPFEMSWQKYKHLFMCDGVEPKMCRCSDEYLTDKNYPKDVRGHCDQLLMKQPERKFVPFGLDALHFMYSPLQTILNELVPIRLQAQSRELVAIHIRTRFQTNEGIRQFFACFQKYRSINPNSIGVLVSDSSELNQYIRKQQQQGILDIIVPGSVDEDTQIGHSVYDGRENVIKKAFQDFYTITIADMAILTDKSTFSQRAANYAGMEISKSLGKGKAMLIFGNEMSTGHLPRYCDVELGFDWPSMKKFEPDA